MLANGVDVKMRITVKNLKHDVLSIVDADDFQMSDNIMYIYKDKNIISTAPLNNVITSIEY